MADVPPPVSPSLPPCDFGRYERGTELGRGAYGQVFECTRDGSGETFAVKVINMRKLCLSVNSERELKKLHREVDILKTLPPHPHIVRLEDVLEEGDWLFLVLELVSRGDLFNTLIARTGRKPRLLEREALFVFWQLVDSLSFLHSHGILHRDLKLENVLIASVQHDGPLVFYNVKITDFGLSKSVRDSLSGPHSLVGTRRYVAPEVLKREAYDFRVDLWSLGILMYILVAGRYPDDQPARVKQEVLDLAISRLEASADVRRMLAGLLQLDPGRRTSMDELRVCAQAGLAGLKVAEDTEAPYHSGAKELGSESMRDTGSLFGSEDLVPPPAPERETSSHIDNASALSVASLRPETAGDVVSAHPSRGHGLMVSKAVFGGNVDADTPTMLVPSAMSVLALAPSSQVEDGLQKSMISTDSVAGEQVLEIAAKPLPPEGEPRHAHPAEHVHADSAEPKLRVIEQPPAVASEAAEDVSHVAGPSTDSNDINLHVSVPVSLSGHILGKGGETLKQAATATGCKIWMTPRAGLADRRIVMSGSYTQCAAAVMWLHGRCSTTAQYQSQEEGQLTVTLLVQAEAVGHVIGRQGCGLDSVHRQSGAKITVLRDEVEGRRPCTISGTLDSVLLAVRLVSELAGGAPMSSMTGSRRSASRSPTGSHIRIRRRCSVDETGRAATTKRQRMEAATKLLIPTQSVGAVIGKQGSGLRQIHGAHGVRIEVLRQEQAPEWSDDRVMTLSGDTAARGAAVEAVLRAAFSASGDPCSLKMLVPSSQAGHVIGKQGSVLKTMHEQYSVKVHVEREEISGERVCIVTGQLGQVAAVASTLLQILDRAVQLSAAPPRQACMETTAQD